MRLRPVQILLATPALAVGAVVIVRSVHLTNLAGLLTATSILTGLTFSMATTFWTKSIEARRRPDQALNERILTSLDETRTHLVWTVVIGLAATAALALISVFSPGGSAPVWVSAIAAALVIYMLTLVGAALHKFYVTAFILR